MENKSASKASSASPQASQGKKPFNKIKRSQIRHFSSVLSILIMLPVFAFMVIFNWVFPRSDVSYIEKRKLAEFPSFSFETYFNGAFTGGVNQWFTDTAPYRDDFKTAGNGFKSLFGIKTENTVTIIGPATVVDKNKKPSHPQNSKPATGKTESSSGSSSDTPSENSTAEESSNDSRDYTQEDAEYTVENGIAVVNQDNHWRALELFGGGSGNIYVAALNDLRSQLDSSIKMYSMIAPLASEYYTPANYAGFTANQKEFFDDIASRLDSGITTVDIDSVLAQHTTENIYLRTDHHWTSLGAYYAAQTFAEAAGVEFKDLSTYTKNTINGFVGTMYAFSGGDIRIKNDPEDFDYYVPENYDQVTAYYYDTSFNYDWSGNFFLGVGDPQSNAYLTFMGGDEQIVKVKTGVKNGRKLLVVKDSYGNAEIGYYFGSFEEIYVVDMRYFNLNLVDFIENKNVTDVLFTMVTYSAFGDNADNLPNLIAQAKGETIVDGAEE